MPPKKKASEDAEPRAQLSEDDADPRAQPSEDETAEDKKTGVKGNT